VTMSGLTSAHGYKSAISPGNATSPGRVVSGAHDVQLLTPVSRTKDSLAPLGSPPGTSALRQSLVDHMLRSYEGEDMATYVQRAYQALKLSALSRPEGESDSDATADDIDDRLRYDHVFLLSPVLHYR
jgi:hypothetical protein